MESIAIVLAAIAVIWLIIWCIRNENVTSIGEQKGLFRMIDYAARSKEAEDVTDAKDPSTISSRERQ